MGPLGRGPLFSWAWMALFAMACGGGGGDDIPQATQATLLGGGSDTVFVLLHGRIGSTLEVEPVLLMDGPSPPSFPTEEATRALGWDDEGEVLFDVQVPAEVVADLPEPELHFSTVVSFPGPSWRLARLEVRAADGRVVSRASSLRGGEFVEELSDRGVEAQRQADGSITVRWDGERLPGMMVRDARDGSVLAIGRGGEVQLTTDAEGLDLRISDGVRSGGRLLPVRP